MEMDVHTELLISIRLQHQEVVLAIALLEGIGYCMRRMFVQAFQGFEVNVF